MPDAVEVGAVVFLFSSHGPEPVLCSEEGVTGTFVPPLHGGGRDAAPGFWREA